jgi:hypothetical protein
MFRLPQRLISAALCFSILISPLAAQGPQVPPGPPQIITPPAPVVLTKPTTAPTEDDLKVPFAIVATVGGEVQTDPVVQLAPGDLLTLTLEGDVTKLEEMSKVAWTSNRSSKNFSNYPIGGGHATFSHRLDAGETHAVFLFSAAVNNPDATAAPLIAQRWVVVGLGPIPPPVTTPTKPTTPTTPPVVVDPSVPPVTPTITAAYWIFEKDDGAVAPYVQTAIDRLMREKKIDARTIEDDVEDGNGTPEAWKLPIAQARQAGLPALVLLANSEVLSVTPGSKLTTDAAIMALVP